MLIFYDCRFDSNGKLIVNMEETVDEARDKALPGFFQSKKKPTTHLQPSTSSSNNPAATVPPEADPNLGEGPPEAMEDEVVQDLVSMTNSDAKKFLTGSLEKKQVIDFVKPRCPDLLSEDVLNNQSFISAMAHSLPKIKEFIASEEKYSSKQE